MIKPIVTIALLLFGILPSNALNKKALQKFIAQYRLKTDDKEYAILINSANFVNPKNVLFFYQADLIDGLQGVSAYNSGRILNGVMVFSIPEFDHSNIFTFKLRNNFYKTITTGYIQEAGSTIFCSNDDILNASDSTVQCTINESTADLTRSTATLEWVTK